MQDKKYLLHPGKVRDPETGRERYVNDFELMQLYDVPQDQCRRAPTTKYLRIDQGLPGQIHLYPLPKGNYQEILLHLEQEAAYAWAKFQRAINGEEEIRLRTAGEELYSAASPQQLERLAERFNK